MKSKPLKLSVKKTNNYNGKWTGDIYVGVGWQRRMKISVKSEFLFKF